MAEITVSGFRRPRSNRPAHRRARVAWVRASHMLWAPIVLGGLLVGLLVGTPHVLMTYTYSDGFFGRVYHSCDYLGQHSQRVIPNDGRCPIIRLLKAEG